MIHSTKLYKGDWVMYEHKIYEVVNPMSLLNQTFTTIKSINKTDNPENITTNVSVKKVTKILYKENAIIKRDKHYLEIVEVIIQSFFNKIQYKCKELDLEETKTYILQDTLLVSPVQIIAFNKEETSNLNSLFKFLKTNQIQDITINFLYEELYKKCNFTVTQLYNILRKIKFYKRTLKDIITHPFSFINQYYQSFTFEKAEKIDEIYELNTPFKIKRNAQPYNIPAKYNSYYVKSSILFEDFKKFCKKEGVNYDEEIAEYLDLFIMVEINGKKYRTNETLLNIEKNMGDNLIELFYDKNYEIDITIINKYITQFETNSIHHRNPFDITQRKAIINSILNKFNIILGFPGTGKSTIIECLIYVFDKLNKIHDIDDVTSKNISIMAPTGLAYVGLKNKIKSNDISKKICGTCHKLLYITYDQLIENKYKLDDKIYHIKLIIVEEFSMVDNNLFIEILNYCRIFGCRLIILGDENQLPSIGIGSVLSQIIKITVFDGTNPLFHDNIIRLTNIYRQNGGILVNNIKKMNNQLLQLNDFDDNTMIYKNITDFIINGNINDYALKQLIFTYNLTKENCKFLSYFKSKKFLFNINNLNIKLQQIFNSENEFICDENIFKINDIVIRTENDNSDKIFRANGEQAVIKHYTKNHNTKIVFKYIDNDDVDDFDNFVEKSSKEYLEFKEEFALAYSLTVHKSQGSQYDTVIIFIDPNQRIWNKKALYTAISRCKQRCIIISTYNDFISAQKNNNEDANLSLFMEEFNEYDVTIK